MRPTPKFQVATRKRVRTALIATVALVWAGCASGPPAPTSTGMLPARWTPAGGSRESSEEVPFTFDGEGTSTGLLSTTLGRGGEHFRGSYVLLQESTQGHVVTAVYDGWSTPEWDLWEKDPDGQWTAMATSFGDFADFYTGKVVAYLPGSKGHAMRCRFTLNQPEAGFVEGGTGECQTSDGGAVALEF